MLQASQASILPASYPGHSKTQKNGGGGKRGGKGRLCIQIYGYSYIQLFSVNAQKESDQPIKNFRNYFRAKRKILVTASEWSLIILNVSYLVVSKPLSLKDILDLKYAYVTLKKKC